jgi:ATP synthase protein I
MQTGALGVSTFRRASPKDCDIILNRDVSPRCGVKDMPTPEERRQMGAAGTAAGLGCSIVASIILCIGGGIVLDQWLDKSPLFTLIGVALGLVAAAYQLYELTQVGRSDREPGPLAKQIQKMPRRRKP